MANSSLTSLTTNWISSHSSLELLNLLRKDLELLLDVECGPWEINESNISPMLDAIDELKERLESLPRGER